MEELIIQGIMAILAKETITGLGTFVVLSLMLRKIQQVEKAQKRSNKTLDKIEEKTELNRDRLKQVCVGPYALRWWNNNGKDTGSEGFS